MKVCHISTVHARYDNRIFNKQCSTLAENGYDTHLIIADGLGDEVKNGVHIWDIGKEAGRFERIRNSTKKAFQRALEIEADLYQLHDPELLPIGLKLKKLKKIVVFDSHEDFRTQISIRPYLPWGIRHAMGKAYGVYENHAFKRLDGIVVPQKSMVDYFNHLNPKTSWVGNSMVIDEEYPLDQKDYTNRTCYHPGSISKSRGILNMVKTMSYLNDPKDKLVLAGPFDSDSLKTEAMNTKGWNKVDYLGKLPFPEVKKFHKEASVGLIMFEKTGQYHFAYTVKLFEFMFYGNAVIIPDFGEWLEFNQEFRCGINVDTDKHEEVAEIIDDLHRNPEKKKELGQKGQKAVLESLNWNTDTKRLLEFYNSLKR